MMYQTDIAQANNVPRLEDYLEAFRQRKWLVLTLFVLGLVAAFLYIEASSATYTATSQVRLRPTPVGSPNNALVVPKLEEESRVLASDAVFGVVAESYPTAVADNLNVKFTPNSNILVVDYTASSAQEAAVIADAFATTYSQQRTAAAEGFYLGRIESNQATVTSAQTELTDLNNQRRQLVADRTALFNQPPSDERAAALDDVQDGLDQITADTNSFRRIETTAQGEILADERAIDTLRALPPGEVLSRAAPPATPDGIPRTLILAVGAILGLVSGLVLAFFLERLDTTARDEEDVALALGTTVMGALPTLGVGHRGGSSSLIMLSAGGSARINAAREAFRRLRSSLLFLNSSSGVSSILVTSSVPGEGKSLTAANLSIALAQNGSRVVLVSADLRRPTLERMFGMEAARPGLAEYLAQTAELNAEKVPGIENLWLIRSGRPPANPGELLNSDRFEQMVKELERENVEYVVVDTPPMLSTADALSAARYVDGVIVVVDAERTNTSDLLQVRADLERSGSKLLGAVINRRKFEGGGLFKRDRYAYYRAESRRLAEG